MPYPGLAAATVLVLGAAVIVLSAALETASAMQVLARDARVPPAVPPVPLRLDPPHWPRAAVPDEVQLLQGARLRCTLLIPAHNEEAVLSSALDFLDSHTRRPDRVLVIADNCTDRTVRVAGDHGVDVFETVGNTEKKAGALNQVLGGLLPETDATEVVLVMDADSTIAQEFLEVALNSLESDPALTAWGSCSATSTPGTNGWWRRHDRVFVLAGTASVIRCFALSAVARARGSSSPGPLGRCTTRSP